MKKCKSILMRVKPCAHNITHTKTPTQTFLSAEDNNHFLSELRKHTNTPSISITGGLLISIDL